MKHPSPLSPHLQVYKLQLTSFLSILHRGTGIFLSMGFFVLVGWLIAMAGGEDSFQQYVNIFLNPLGSLMLVGWCFSFFYHLLNGIRHLFWDFGYGFQIKSVYKSGILVFILALTCTGVTFYLAFSKYLSLGRGLI